MQTLPPVILAHFEPFRDIFLTQKTYLKASLMLLGAIMCRGARTVCSILKVLGLKGEASFAKYHHVLNRSGWDALKGSKVLLKQIDQNHDDPLELVVDTHLERRKGRHISAKGHYRDATQSSDKCTVISSGLKWLCLKTIKQYSWFKRPVALPFLTILMPSEEGNKKSGKRHKTLVTWTKQAMMQIRRWLPHRKIILVGDSEFATAELTITAKKQKISFVSRLKLNARLFDFPFPVKIGRPRNKGLRLLSAKEQASDPNLDWKIVEVDWYGGVRKQVAYVTRICLWHVMGYHPMIIRYVLVKDPNNEFQPVILMSSDDGLDAIKIIETYVKRWNIEVTFHEAREHLGIETQRQWSSLAILRSTPILFGLYSLIILIGASLVKMKYISIEKTAWYSKETIKFSDVLRGVRREILKESYFCNEPFLLETELKSAQGLLSRVLDLIEQVA